MSFSDRDILSASHEELIDIGRHKQGEIISKEPFAPTVLRLSEGLVMKYGVGVSVEEAINQDFASRCNKLSILQVPQVHRFFQYELDSHLPSIGIILMEYVEGVRLDEISPAILDHIALAVSGLDLIKAPEGHGPGPELGGPPRGILWSEYGACTSFRTIDELQSWLIDRARMLDKKASIELRSYELVLCHMDLARRNILLTSKGKLCLLDWADAGFYPAPFQRHCLFAQRDSDPAFAEGLLQRLSSIDEDFHRFLCLIQAANTRYLPAQPTR